MIKVVIFDFDGVIVESVDIKTRAFGKLFEDRGAQVMKKVTEYHLANTGVSRFDKFKYIYKEMLGEELSKEVFDQLCQGFSRLVVDDVVNAPYVDGAFDFLKENKAKYKFYVISATPQKEIEEIIARRGITSYFREIYGSPNTKDDVIKRIISQETIRPDEAVFVGDALGDYNAARASSVHFIARIGEPKELFDKVDCIKMPDLRRLAGEVAKLAKEKADA